MRSGSDADGQAIEGLAFGTQRRQPTVGTLQVPGEAWAFVAISALMIIGGGLVAAINSVRPFDHGSWLAAYLVLVGGVSQLALGAGSLMLSATPTPPLLRRLQIGLWNIGTVVVAAGVFVDLEAVVLSGSALVLAALGCFAVGGGARPGARGRLVAYRLFIGALAISVLVGGVLAGAAPGT